MENKKLIEKLETLHTDLCNFDFYNNKVKMDKICESPRIIKQAIKALQMADDMRWIPCSERLPKENRSYKKLGCTKPLSGSEYCLVSLRTGVAIDFLQNGKWVNYGDAVEAWMPLPQPYKESEE